MTILSTTFVGLSIGVGSVADMPEGAESVLFVLTLSLGAYVLASLLEERSRDIETRRWRRRRHRGHA